MSEKPKVALDVDSTIARTCDVAFELLDVEDQYSYNDISSWEWGVEEFGEVSYLSALWNAWAIRPSDIEPFEDVGRLTETLYERTETLDIVTAHPDDAFGVTEGKRDWLDAHNVSYDELRVEGDKHLLEYDLIVDDNPHLVGKASYEDNAPAIMLYDQPYNQSIDDVVYRRVYSLEDVIYLIKTDDWQNR